MRFISDPRLPVGVETMVAQRREAGYAFLWKPGGSIEALLEFVGDKFVAVDDHVYERMVDGTLRPLVMATECVWFKALAGDGLVGFTFPSFVSLFAIVEDSPDEREKPAKPVKAAVKKAN